MTDFRHVYLETALSQIPRVLTLQDRNPFSPTYGSFHRAYWLDKAIDFPDAMAQFAVQALALVYANEFPGNPYFRHPKIREWTVAGLDYWARIQHADGSFDEFYPYERGWVGPTGFTLYTALEAHRLIQDEIPADVDRRVRAAIRRAAHFVAAGEAEEDRLANHHALACLAVWKAHEFLGEAELKTAFERLWQGFLRYHNRREGWSMEYDGADPGYLSATVSFLAKLYQHHPAPEVLEVAEAAIEFASHFVYPDGHYGGSLGSRQTVHFYPHGVEVLAEQLPMAGALARKMLEGLAAGALVPPTMMPDRYLPWRLAEYLLAYRDARPRSATLPALPCERPPFRRWFPDARIYIRRDAGSYILVNLAKGGVVKAFNTDTGRQVYSDCGIIGCLESGQMVSSQWIASEYRLTVSDDELVVEGSLQRMTSTSSFTPLKMALFRIILATIGRSTRASHLIKGTIRKVLMLGTTPAPLRFRRRIRLEPGAVTVMDEVRRAGRVSVAGLMFGDEFAVRYVPQSRYFQLPELDVRGHVLTPAELARFNNLGRLSVSRRVEIPSGRITVAVSDEPVIPAPARMAEAARTD